MRLTKLVFVAVVVLAIGGIVAWQRFPMTSSVSADVPAADVPAAVAKDAPVEPVAADAPAAKEAAPVAAATVPKPATKPAKRTAPAAAGTKVAASAAPSPATAAPAKELPRMTYAERVTDAAKTSGEDVNKGLGLLQQLANEEPARPEAYEAMAGIRLRNHEYTEAHEAINRALAHGGKATFAVIHDHTSGNFDRRDPKATCAGEMTIVGNEVSFTSAATSDHFSAMSSTIRDTGPNKFFGSNMGAFHVTFTDNGKYKNFNLAPQSRDKAEGQLILDLLKSYTRKR